MTTLATRSPLTAKPDDSPFERLYRITPEQFRIANEAGVFPNEDYVQLVDGLLHWGGPNGPIYLLKQEQYRQMDEVGALTTEDRAELLGGWLVPKMVLYPPHRISTYETRRSIERRLPPGWYADEQKPIALPRSRSEPEPDIQVTRGHSRLYFDRHPGPNDLRLVVEVSDSSLAIDQGFKLRLYALEGIPIYWIVNLVDLCLEVYTNPSGLTDEPTYLNTQHYGPEDEVPLTLEGVEVGRILVRELLP